ncbi:MAG: hypothetical protein J6A89_08765 [Clostridia bacterium]|nr:hypothetical protein [Clostridia bacterium]
MKLKEIYSANQERRYKSVTKIKKEDVKLEMNPYKKIKENWILLLIFLIIIIAIFLIDFNQKIFFASIILGGLLVLTFIFGNKSILVCDKNTLNIKQGFQKVNIPYANLKNVYIGRVAGTLFFLPSKAYNIVIRYQDNFSFLREIEFSLLCANAEDVNEFINNFLIDDTIQERYVKYERRKLIFKILGSIASIALFIIIFMYFFTKGGINFIPLI